ncbi:MAG: AmmeMemoRadiSam system protein A [Bdellovibrionales bacterium]|jgi:AmmeMemoRadiSam system protein A|nr:AmmeMemoRadiSam system protein A [Bdellovibrionales bacterium]MBT3526142.1 AmmeMemoRadiSam system protein A [Bdellovibrionales bacterium]MBT7768207.1 AmmeMemoRadiSam system protein A [Bdellovibrionales bacterium]
MNSKTDNFSFKLSSAEQQALKDAALSSITGQLKGTAQPSAATLEKEHKKLQQLGGGFVTLTIDNNLRGCIGEIFPSRSIAQVVIARAVDAAFGDYRFPNLTLDELNQIEIEISLLSPPWEISNYQEIEVGVHGIVLTKDSCSAVFLPQVAPEQGWDLATTLSQLALKAGLSADSWREGASFSVFTADVF